MRALVWLLVAGCAVEAEPEPEDTGSTCAPEWDDARPVTIAYCDACHASTTRDRHEAPADVIFDTEAEAARWADRIVARVAAGEMPPGGGVSEADLARLEEWAECARVE